MQVLPQEVQLAQVLQAAELEPLELQVLAEPLPQQER
jgi:hypothetical protein